MKMNFPPNSKISVKASYARSRATIVRDSGYAHELTTLENLLSQLTFIDDLNCSQCSVYKNSDIALRQYSQHIISDENNQCGDFFLLAQNFATISYKNINITVSLNSEEKIVSFLNAQALDLPDNFEEEFLLPLLVEAHKQQLLDDILNNQLVAKNTLHQTNEMQKERVVHNLFPLLEDSRRYGLSERQILTTVKRTRLPLFTSNASPPFAVQDRTRLLNTFIISSSPHVFADGAFRR
jgi:hypothetical protein